ncbi:Ig-like domain-containing protein [Brevibacillus dissolubilis]|uniref:Ig-like domain-containing protein n=1 Tax=Brevibacillus dissolubilis TaxID=1844116 RepID=UPI00111613E3|nr:Ig-like domain-containing protein [Brevibacillus dissolubilis]
MIQLVLMTVLQGSGFRLGQAFADGDGSTAVGGVLGDEPLALTRTLSKNSIKLGQETTTITYTLTPVAQKATAAQPITGIRPIWMPNETYVVGAVYPFTEDRKDHGNRGGLTLEGNGGNRDFHSVIMNGYQQPVTIGDMLLTKPGNVTKEVNESLLALYRAGTREITLPLADPDEVDKGRDYITALGFATFTLTYDNATATVVGVFKEYAKGLNLKLTDFTFTETISADLEIVSTDAMNSNAQIRLNQGKITATLPPISYTRIGDTYQASPVSFSVTVKAKTKGEHKLQNATLQYRDIYGQAQTGTFNNLTLNVQIPLTGVQLDQTQLILYLDHPDRSQGRLQATVSPGDTDNPAVRWSSLDPSIAQVDQNGMVKAVKPGVTTVKVETAETDTNGKPYTDTCQVIVTSQPQVSLGAHNGWNAMYPEQATITIVMSYHAFEPPSTLLVKVNGQPVHVTDIRLTSTTPLDNGKVARAYQFIVDVNADTYGGPFTGKVPLEAQITNKYGYPSDVVREQLIVNPLSTFQATGRLTQSGEKPLGAITVTPPADRSRLIPDVQYGWIYQPADGKVSDSTRWNVFTPPSTGDIPLNPSGATVIWVAMLQDFNGDSRYTGQNETVVYRVTIGQTLPDFRLIQQETYVDEAIVQITTNPSTVSTQTQWSYYSPAEQKWIPITLGGADNPGNFSQEIFVVPFRKDENGRLVPTEVQVKAVTPGSDSSGTTGSGSAGGSGSTGAGSPDVTTVKTIVIQPPTTGTGNGNGSGSANPGTGTANTPGPDGDLLDDPYLYARPIGSSQENRASQVVIGFGNFNTERVRVIASAYTISKVGAASGTSKPLTQAISLSTGKSNVLLKSSTGQSTNYRISVSATIEIYNVKGEKLRTKTLVDDTIVRVQAKNTME